MIKVFINLAFTVSTPGESKTLSLPYRDLFLPLMVIKNNFILKKLLQSEEMSWKLDNMASERG